MNRQRSLIDPFSPANRNVDCRGGIPGNALTRFADSGSAEPYFQANAELPRYGKTPTAMTADPLTATRGGNAGDNGVAGKRYRVLVCSALVISHPETGLRNQPQPTHL